MTKLYDRMIGGTYLWNGDQHTIEDVIQTEKGYFAVKTDKRTINVSANELRKEFKPVDLPVRPVHLSSAEAAVIKYAEQESQSMKSLEDTLVKQIAKLETDASYIKQAKAVNETATRIIGLQKNKIEALKLVVAVKR